MHLMLSEPSTAAVWIETASLAMEGLAIVVIVIGILYGAVRFLLALIRHANGQLAYAELKSVMGRGLLLGLEILVAADIVRTVALTPTLESVAVLGILVLIRTFLGWSVIVELEGRWPWREAEAREREAAAEHVHGTEAMPQPEVGAG